MALSEETETLIVDTLELAEENDDKLTDWDRNFLFGEGGQFKSIKEAYDTYKENMFISPKQIESIQRIYNKLSK